MLIGLDKIVHYADPYMRTTMLSRLDINCVDYLRQAEELAVTGCDLVTGGSTLIYNVNMTVYFFCYNSY